MTAIKMTLEKNARIIELHAAGLSNIAIAGEIGVSSSLVNILVKRHGLLPNGRRGPEMVGAAQAKCKKCKEVKSIEEFLIVEKGAHRKSTFTMSRCKSCWNRRVYSARNRTVESQIRYKLLTLKNRSKRERIANNLSYEDMFGLWEAQGGRCFYTDVELDITAGTGRKPNSLSVDRLIPNLGYELGNVVICADRINTMKQDATLEEMELWMPAWHGRIMAFLSKTKGVSRMKHVAHTMAFDDLWQGLQEAKAAGLVREQTQEDLHLFVYSEKTVYEKHWTPWTVAARGLILDRSKQKIVATPFEKFFNYGERADQISSSCKFEALEKVDGSLIILFYHAGTWRTATKGSFNSQQALDAKNWLKSFDLSGLCIGTTYLLEWTSPENRIVVRYEKTGLTLLGAYREDGSELPYNDLAMLALKLGWDIAKRFAFNAMSDLIATAKALPGSEEGFVLRFEGGERLKVKGDEYCRIHRLVSRVTPLAMWAAMAAGDDLEALRRELPEEFWADFDAIIAALRDRLDRLLDAVRVEAEAVADLSDKEVGLRLATIPEPARRFVFPYRKNGGDLLTGRTRETIFREIRPTGNVLPGYEPSSTMNRVLEEVA